MMAAREEDVPSPASALLGGAPGPDDADQGSGPEKKRGQKRSRQEATGLGEEEAISTARVHSLTSLVARVFARRQCQQLSRVELFEAVNGNLMEGELPFEEEEFQAGLVVMEARNKVFMDESGDVMLVG